MSSKRYRQFTFCRNSYKEKNLSGRDFSGADIRGICFKNKILIGTNFSNAQAGLTLFSTFSLITVSFILTITAGLVIGYSSAFPAFIFTLLAEERSIAKEFLIILGILVLASFIIIILLQGLGKNVNKLGGFHSSFHSTCCFPGLRR